MAAPIRPVLPRSSGAFVALEAAETPIRASTLIESLTGKFVIVSLGPPAIEISACPPG